MRRAWVIGVMLAGCGFGGATGDGNAPDAPRPDDAPVDAPTGSTDDADPDATLNPGPDAEPDSGFTSVSQVCMDAGYTAHGLAFYRLVETGTSWEQAELDCEDDLQAGTTSFASSHLAVIKSAPETAAVDALGGGNVWVGYTDRRDEGALRYVTDELTPFAPQVDGNVDMKDCVQLRGTNGFAARDCADMESYVCECDLFPANPDSY